MNDQVRARRQARKERRLVRRIERFQERFAAYGDAHLFLAFHAAFPLILTPDLVYRMWVNFDRDEDECLLDIPWIATADLLLSDLCQEAGYELYEMDPDVRQELLQQFKAHPSFGEARLTQLANFLKEYSEHLRQDQENHNAQALADVHLWTALSHTDPDEAVREMLAALKQGQNDGDNGEVLRMTNLTAKLAGPYKEKDKPLLVYLRGMEQFAQGHGELAAQQFQQLQTLDLSNYQTLGIDLAPPEMITEIQEPAIEEAGPAVDRVLGIDLAPAYARDFDYRRAAAAGVKFCFIRAGSGQMKDDEGYRDSFKQAGEAGMLRGLYFTIHPEGASNAGSMEAQAGYFASLLLDEAELGAVVDVELKDLTPEMVKRFVSTFQEKEPYRRPVTIYTSPGFWDKEKGFDGPAGKWAAEHPLWIAHYPSPDQPEAELDPAFEVKIPGPWASYRFHQWTNKGGKLAGQERPELDLNYFNGSLDELRAWARERPDPQRPAEPWAEEVPRDRATRATPIPDTFGIVELLNGSFTISELEQLCADLGADYEKLPGDSKEAKVQILVTILVRRDRADKLQELVARMRPELDWPVHISPGEWQRYQLQIAESLSKSLDDSIFEVLSFDLSVEYEDPPSGDLSQVALKLVSTLAWEDRLEELRTTAIKLRLNIAWPERPRAASLLQVTGVRYVTADSGLSLRLGPGPEYEALQELGRGAAVEIVDASGEWVYVRVGDETGYVPSEYLAGERPPAEERPAFDRMANPYVGPRTFAEQDKWLFYGRDKEIEQLFSALDSYRVVLLYGDAGTGKSSLVQAGLIPRLRANGVDVLPVGRVGGAPPQFRESDAAYVVGLQESLGSRGEGEYVLSQFLQRTLAVGDDPARAPRQLLIIDQLEEMFAAQERLPGAEELLSQQLQEALEAIPYLGIVLVIRSDYFSDLLRRAERLTRPATQGRLELQALGPKAALQAIRKPAEAAGRNFEPGAAEALVERLLGPEGTFIEPLELQLLCYELWQRLEPDDDQITPEHVRALPEGDPGLVRFYDETVARVAAESGLAEATLRDWLEEQLITAEGTRNVVLVGQDQTEGLPNRAVDLLSQSSLLRREQRREQFWVELFHDRLVESIRQSNRAWREGQEAELEPAGLAEQQRYHYQIEQLIVTQYSLEDFRMLCLDLAVDYDDLPAVSRPAQARELVRIVVRQGRLEELHKNVAEMRPHATWPEAPRADGEPEILGTRAVTAESGLNMRSGPGTEFDVLRALPRGTAVEIIVEAEWALVRVGDETGYVVSEFLGDEQVEEEPRPTARSIIGFHNGPDGDRRVMGDFMRRLNEQGQPFFMTAVDQAGIIHEAIQIGQRAGVNNWLVYRTSAASMSDVNEQQLLDYSKSPDEAAKIHWDRTLASWPRELDPESVWLEPINEPRTWLNDGDQVFEGLHPVDWLGRFMLALAEMANNARPRFKICGPAFASGQPEVFESNAYELPGMLAYLRYCAENPDLAALSVHEYAGDGWQKGESWPAWYPASWGRVEAAFAAADKHNISPNFHVFITEWGFTHESAPGWPECLPHVVAYNSWAARWPQVKGAAIGTAAWSLQSGLAPVLVIQSWIAPLAGFTLSREFDAGPQPAEANAQFGQTEIVTPAQARPADGGASEPAMAPPADRPIDMKAFDAAGLGKAMIRYLSPAEMPQLALSLEVDYEALQAQGSSAKAKALIVYLQRRNRVHELFDALLTIRPEVDWHAAAGLQPEETAEAAADAPIEEALPTQEVPETATKSGAGPPLEFDPPVDESKDDKLRVLARRIRQDKCLPLLGDAFFDDLLPAGAGLAREWARQVEYPFALDEGDLLAHVAQYEKARGGNALVTNESYLELLKETLLAQAFSDEMIPGDLIDQLKEERHRLTVTEVAEKLGPARQLADSESPVRLLAEMPLGLFITTSHHTFLESALRRTGKNPRTELCHWLDELGFAAPSVFDDDPDYEPRPEEPLVYHLYGLDSVPESLVLSEDDYVDFVLALGADPDLLPVRVRQALASSSALALGLSPSSLAYKVLQHILFETYASTRRLFSVFVADLEDSGEAPWQDSGAQREALDRTFAQGDFEIYWASAGEFLKRLRREITE